MTQILNPPAIVRSTVVDAEVMAAQIVARVKAARQKAEAAEAESSPSRWEEAEGYAELASLRWSVRRIADECEASKSAVGRCIQIVSRYRDSGNRPTFWQAYAEVTGEAKAVHVSQATGQPEWYTPAEYIEAARKVLGEIELDPASSTVAQKTVLAKLYYTADDDGLSKGWAGRVWLNPPYAADLVGKFVDKLCEHFLAGDVPAALLLVNNATETTWFQRAAKLASAIVFPKGRVKFLDENGEPGAPLQGQVVLYFGADTDGFLSAFGEFGFDARLRNGQGA
jgi:hypothetical protein